jgi:hypothetical protein
VVVGFQSKLRYIVTGGHQRLSTINAMSSQTPKSSHPILLSRNKPTKRTRGILNFLKQRNRNCFASHDGVMRKGKKSNRYPPMASLAKVLQQFNSFGQSTEKGVSLSSTSRITTVDFPVFRSACSHLAFSSTIEVSSDQVAASPLVAATDTFPTRRRTRTCREFWTRMHGR